MLAYLIRHAAALPKSAPGVSKDSLRPLTLEGVKQMKEAAAGLATVAKPELVVCSPYLRAMETARILASALESAPPVETSEALLPDASPSGALSFVGRARASSVALVGHEPQMGELASLMITGSTSSKFPFRKGAACCIEFPSEVAAGTGELRWHLTPEILRRLATSP